MQDTTQSRLISSRIGQWGVAVLLIATTLAGCATTSDLPATEAEIVRPSQAMILPPPGGPSIVTVVSTTFPNAIRQDISLATEAR
ncbi:MAG: cellulose biosynthesis protein BcsN, partial [Hyphomicrobiales bacterium]